MFETINQYMEILLGVVTAVGLIFTASKWVFKINKNIDVIVHEMSPNSGTSIKDKVNSIERQINHDSKLIETICARQRWLLDHSNEIIFESDENGKCTWVNDKYCNLFEYDVDYFMGNGWKNIIYNDDLDRIEKNWERCVKDARDSSDIYRVVNKKGEIFKIHATVKKTAPGGFIGSIKVLEKISE